MLGAETLATATLNRTAAPSESPSTGAYSLVGAALNVTLEIWVISHDWLHW